MATMNPLRPLTGGPGYGPQQQLPVTGATRLGVSAQAINDSPALFNQWLHAQPWYVEAIRQWGLDPRQPSLSPQQRAQLADAAARAGVDTSGGNGAFGIDTHGNFEDVSIPTWDKAALTGFGAAAGGAAVAGLAGSGTAASGAGGLVGSGEAASTATALPAAGVGTSVLGATAPTITGVTAPATGVGASLASGSWLTSPYASLASAGLNTFGQIYGANKAASANEQAAALQAASFDKALAQAQKELDYQHGLDTLKQTQYGSYLGRLQPYQASGEQANDRLAQFAGQPGASGGTNVTPATTAALRQPPGTPPAQPALSAPTPTATVRLKAPDGTEKDVPVAQAPHFIKLGAVQVGQGA